jgi:DNA adenine methylase
MAKKGTTRTATKAGFRLADQIASAAAKARRAMEALGLDEVDVEKTIWSSPAGKKRLAKRLAAMLPSQHRAYVEPFVGSGAVLFAKHPAELEVINDADASVADAYRTIKKLTPAHLARLEKLSWTGSRDTFLQLFDSSPKSELKKLHRFLYITHFSYAKTRRRGFSPTHEGVPATTVARLRKHGARLAKVKVYGTDYEPVVRKYDGPDTVFFLDPPYSGFNAWVGESRFDEHRFARLLKDIKGRWLMTYGIRGELPRLVKDAGFPMKRIRTRRAIRRGVGGDGPGLLTQIVAANYDFTRKSIADIADDIVLEDWDPRMAAEFSLTAPILKAEVEERYVLGIVLEPETVDAQGDIYSVEEVRKAAHTFMEVYRGVGLQHQVRVDDRVKILESYLAPEDLELGGVAVRKGTWLLAVRVLDDEIWSLVKDGTLSGLSIGGTATKVPETAHAVEAA